MRQLIAFFFGVTAVCCLVLTVNHEADVEGYWRAGDYSHMQPWPKGKAWHFGSWRAQRAAKVALIQQLPRPDLAVFGSSRAQFLGRPQLKRYPALLNLYVVSSGLMDMAGLWQCLVEEDKVPSTVLLIADPWLINEGLKQDYWVELAPYLYRFILQSGLAPAEKFSTLDHLWRESIELGFRRGLGLKTFKESRQRLRDRDLRVAEGFQDYSEFAKERMAGMFEDGAFINSWRFGLGWVKKGSFSPDGSLDKMEGWGDSRALKRLFREWLRQLRQRGCRVVVADSPIYGPYREAMEKRYPAAFKDYLDMLKGFEAEGLIQKLVLKRTPQEYGCPEDQYYDPSHVFPECLGRIAKEALAP